MQAMDDMALLREYATNNSEAAFETLVSQRIGFVYSAALRQVRDPHLAEEITQAVFIILAQKAGRISDKTILTGWLFRTTRFAVLAQMRADAKRRRREREANMQSEIQPTAPDLFWEQMSPLLDEALATLGETDRQAVLLRFLDNKSMAEVGNQLGTGEDTARKRVSRALEKLRRYFSKRGVSSTTAFIAGAISANSVQAAPVGLVKSVTAVAMANGAAASGSTLTLIKGALKIMAWTKAKTAVVAGASVLLAVGTITITAQKIITPTLFLQIKGKGQIELYTKPPRVVETADLVILTDGKSYRISIASHGHSGLTNDVYDVNADYGCDGADTFVLSDRLSAFHRTREGFAGFAYSGRFPGDQFSTPAVTDAAWLAYCSKDYFNVPSNRTGLKLFDEFSMVGFDYITNQVTYWPDSTLPQRITGWSRNWVIGVRTNSNQPKQAVELKQYPNGFKAWKFTASDPVTVGTMQVPRQITLETFFPKPPDTATTGDDTELLRKATFVIDSIEVVKGRINLLPSVTVPDLQVEDWRFRDIAGNFLIESHATPKGWPTRGSGAFKQALTKANQIASQNRTLIQTDLKRTQTIIPP